jgi:Ca-activated chloride channel homolog
LKVFASIVLLEVRMKFLWPLNLLAILLVIGLAFWLVRRLAHKRSESFASHPDIENIALASPAGRNWKRVIAAAFYATAVGVGLLAFARPQGTLPMPDERAGIMLAIDVSGSMRADDIKPSRMEAAKTAAYNFVKQLPPTVKVGMVSFSGYAQLESAPTTDHALVLEKIQALERRRGTAIGEGLLESVKAFPSGAEKILGLSTVILLSDGRNTSGILPAEASKKASQNGVKVHTIGVGTPTPPSEGQTPFGGFDETELRGIAKATGGQYYSVDSATKLEQVYTELRSLIAWRWQKTEITAIAGALAGVLVLVSLLISSWQRRII